MFVRVIALAFSLSAINTYALTQDSEALLKKIWDDLNKNDLCSERFKQEAPNLDGGWECPTSKEVKQFQDELHNLTKNYKQGKDSCSFIASVDKKGITHIVDIDAKSRRHSCETPFKLLSNLPNIKIEKPSPLLKHIRVTLPEEKK